MIPDLGAIGTAPLVSDSAMYALAALLITTLGALYKASSDNRAMLRKMEMQHEENREDRAAKAAALREQLAREAEVTRAQAARDAEAVRARLELAATVEQQRQDANALRLRDRLEDTARDVARRVDDAVTIAKATAATELGVQTDVLKHAIDEVKAVVVIKAEDTAAVQTTALTHVIETAQAATTDRTDAALEAANNVNAKMTALHETNAALEKRLAEQGQALAELLRTVERRGAPRPAGDTTERRVRDGTAADRRPVTDDGQTVVAIVGAKA